MTAEFVFEAGNVSRCYCEMFQHDLAGGCLLLAGLWRQFFFFSFFLVPEELDTTLSLHSHECYCRLLRQISFLVLSSPASSATPPPPLPSAAPLHSTSDTLSPRAEPFQF